MSDYQGHKKSRPSFNIGNNPGKVDPKVSKFVAIKWIEILRAVEGENIEEMFNNKIQNLRHIRSKLSRT